MTTQLHRTAPYLLAAALALAAGPAAAQTRGGIGQTYNFEQLIGVISQALPPLLTEDNSGLLKQLMAVPIADPLTKTFSLQAAKQGAFGFAQPQQGPDCGRAGTPVGEPDQGECNLTAGSPGGDGAFRQLSFSKNLGVGNIRYLRRDGAVDPTKLQPVTLEDPAAQDMAVNFLIKFFGIPISELPLPPTGARNPGAFVSTLTLSGDDGTGATKPLPLVKLITIPRGLNAGLKDAAGNVQQFVPAPGHIAVLVGNNGVIGAQVENWQELRMDPNLDPKNAKPKSQLATEIARDLVGEAGGGAVRLAGLSAHIVFQTDFRGNFGLLVPAVMVYATPVNGDLSPADFDTITNGHIGTAGFAREYSLVASPESVPGATR
jgi:hypothetical protein